VADPWDAFADADGGRQTDPWAGFEDAGPASPRTSRPPRLPAPQAVAGKVAGAIDGDTLRLDPDGSLRIWGIDAPELHQRGWDRQGQPVPIGRQAQQAAQADINSAESITLGNPVSRSYGRVVAPVGIDNSDLGLSITASGNALAAPDYLSTDPARRFSYMQAERLARLNRLGLHNTFSQTPAQFRADPGYRPERETIARFWDTPTPFAGLRPEDEQRYLALLGTARDAQEVVDFIESKGLKLDATEVGRWIEARDKARANGTELPLYMRYQQMPRAETDPGDGRAGAVGRGLANGVLPNMLEEAGAVVDILGGTANRENIWNSDRRLADIYANNLAQNHAITRHDHSAYPLTATLSEIAGGLAPVGRVSSLADLVKFGAGYGTVAGLGQEGTIPERLTSGVIGGGLGLTTAVAGGKALEAASPYVGRLASRFTRNAPRRAPAASMDDIAAYPVADAPAAPSQAMDAPGMPSLSQELPRQRDYLFPQRPQPIDQPLTDAQIRAASETVTPGDVVPIPSNVVANVEEAAAMQAGRFEPARVPHERTELTRRTVKGWNGADVPKVGPIDLVGWVRLQGGLADQGGELSHMGMTNAMRPDKMDFVGQEVRFGPLVSDQGMNLDDAALRAWEAGYFPELAERPTINQFLEGLRDTYEGRNRRFLADDMPEVERFENTRSERLDLARQASDEGAPIWTDKSVPADEPAPFPPARAYEEWPSGGPDYAGNIDLRKLETPQDIKRALDFTNRRVGFDAATRGRVAQAETERLAAELGMTPERLLSRRKGQALNAEEALAARQILAKSGNELVNAAKRIRALDEPGDELLADFRQKWMRHVAIQEQVAGATAEAGRALSQFKMAASSRAVRGDVLAALVNSGGGKNRIKDAAKTLLDAVESGPGVFNIVAEKATKPRFSDKLVEVYINWLLSGPQTHAVNVASNTLTAIAQLPEHAVAAGVGKARQLLPGAALDRVVGSEVGARAFGLLQGAREGARMFAQALRTGEPSDFVSKVEGQQWKAISGRKGEVISIPTRLLTAEDEFFKGVARRMELNGLAVRMARKEGLRGKAAQARIAELSAHPTDDMLAQSMDYARYLTFQRQLGPVASKVSQIAQEAPPVKLFLPFVRTPTNLLKFALERSPAAPLLKEWRQDWLAGGARRDLAVAKMLVGTGFGMAIYQAAAQGLITGSAPGDKAKARLLYADGWQPYSIRLGDKWYSYKRFDPFSTTIGVAADMATVPGGMSERQLDDKATLLVASIMGNLASKTWLSGISDLVGALFEPDQNADRLLKRLAGAVTVPAGVAQVARTVDPVSRMPETVGEHIQSRIPFASKSLPPRRDVWGREVVNEGGIGPDILSPVWQSTAKDDPVNRELLRAGVSVGMVPGKVGGQRLTPAQRDRYQADAGQSAYRSLQSLIGSPGWRSADAETRKELAEKAIQAARKQVRERLFSGNTDSADPWSQFRDGGSAKIPRLDPWQGFGDPAQRDIVGDLQRAIPGIGMTSGFRTPAYQADMRRRGYAPANNSGHLDGSSLDLTPPPGKSMAWLRQQVRRAHPNAHLLDEGDHLHATFPGWYSAPALGGAKAAGLRNPMLGQ
jgi:endonuclease YncB( thermonuclease family)